MAYTRVSQGSGSLAVRRGRTPWTGLFKLPVAIVIGLVMTCMVGQANAFGAGELPSYSSLSKSAYRHGTIENVLENIAKVAAHQGPGAGRLIAGVAGAFLSGNAGNLGDLVSGGGGGDKFSGLDIKRVYFGNWLRDYSQAMDIAGLSKLSGDSILLLIMCLGFMAFGYATEEFEVTKEKLGVYLCTEHIDNPKGYGEGQDARQYDDRLRPPVDDRELEIDERNGMKKYIASEGEGFDTSTDCIRRHLRRCIELGRQSGEKEKFEAYRELGTALHTLEDFLAHSNYLELALNKLGHRNVFCHVGDNCRIRAPNGQNVPPIVTGTFGSSDFLISVLGEVGDKLSSSTVTDLQSKFNDAKNQNDQQGGGLQLIKTLMGNMPSGGGDNQDVESKLNNVEEIRKNAVNIDPDQIASEEVQRIFLEVLRTRDSIFKQIEQALEAVGLDEKIDELSNALSVLVLTTIEPYVTGIIKTVSEGLNAGSEAILQQEDQLVVFNDDNASDPTHSVLSKDHFDLWLNEPAGKVAVEVVKHTVPLVVQAWSDESADPDQVISVILQAIHHPYFARDDCEIHRVMLDTVRGWVDGLDSNERNKILMSLTKESVKAGNNKREDAESYGTLGHRCSGPGHDHHAGAGAGAGYAGSGSGSHRLATGNRISENPAQHRFGQGSGEQSSSGGYNSRPSNTGYGGQGQTSGIAAGFGGMQQGIGERMEQRYGRQDDDSTGGRGSSAYGNDRREEQYSSTNQYNRPQEHHRLDDEENRYQQDRPYAGHGTQDYEGERVSTSYNEGRREDNDHGASGRIQRPYGGDGGEGGYRRNDDRDDNDRPTYEGGGGSSFNRGNSDGNYNSQGSYGRRENDDDDARGSRYEHHERRGGDNEAYPGQGHGRRDYQDDTTSRFARMNVGESDYGGLSNDGPSYEGRSERHSGYGQEGSDGFSQRRDGDDHGRYRPEGRESHGYDRDNEGGRSYGRGDGDSSYRGNDE